MKEDSRDPMMGSWVMQAWEAIPEHAFVSFAVGVMHSSPRALIIAAFVVVA
jgi:hypothetical protein